jgi:hypothetical protein
MEYILLVTSGTKNIRALAFRHITGYLLYFFELWRFIFVYTDSGTQLEPLKFFYVAASFVMSFKNLSISIKFITEFTFEIIVFFMLIRMIFKMFQSSVTFAASLESALEWSHFVVESHVNLNI